MRPDFILKYSIGPKRFQAEVKKVSPLTPVDYSEFEKRFLSAKTMSKKQKARFNKKNGLEISQVIFDEPIPKRGKRK